MAKRAISTALLAAIACLATFAVVQYKDSTMQEFMAESVKDDSKVDVLHNIINLKAYCMAAYDEARILMATHKSVQSIVEFVMLYGQEGGGDDLGGKQAHVENIVTEYSNLIGAMRAKYGTGVNRYVLDHIDQAIRQDPKGAMHVLRNMEAFGNGGAQGRKYGHLAALRTPALGLEDTPQVVVEMAVSHPTYLHFKTLTDKYAENADLQAATVFLKSKQEGHYESFLQREIAKVERKMRQYSYVVNKAGYKAAGDAYMAAYEANRQAFFKHVNVQAGAAWKAAEAATASMAYQPPTMKELIKLANEHAKKFVAKMTAGTDTATLLKSIADEAGGVKITLETAGSTNAQSSMKPAIKIVGKTGTLTGTIRAVPAQGATFVQHMPSDQAIGDIEHIEITGTGSDMKWKCKHFRVRSGSKDADTVVFSSGAGDGFWVNSGETVRLTPDAAATFAGHHSNKACGGFKGTAQCKGDGSSGPTAENDRDCGTTIDSSMSGYCECNGKKVAAVDCGHDNFKCSEMCKFAS